MKIDPELRRECDEAGITIWRKPLPPVRQPVRLPDGRLVLDFASSHDRQKFKQECTEKVAANCLNGARSVASQETQVSRATGSAQQRIGSAQQRIGSAQQL
eukprot:GHUV01045984.1.p1 GENE.GHUV01045984.1~~GHUV01045984.1.p1  ORF type:complete len:101 (+),score=18.96 GHUV01045984.1:1165-1467(+)